LSRVSVHDLNHLYSSVMSDSQFGQSEENSNYSGVNELYMAENFLKNYSSHIVDLICRFSEIDFTENTRVVEFGAGTGQLAIQFFRATTIKPVCIEIDPTLRFQLTAKSLIAFASVKDLDGTPPDLIYTSNVLEHIENDTQVLIDLRKSLSAGGSLAIYVPAIPLLFGEMDRRVGHFRRYTRGELVFKLFQAGFEIEHIRFVDSLGVLATLITNLLGYKNRYGLGGKFSMIFYDNVLFKISRVLDFLGFRFFLGKNLFVIAKVSK
jgi:SAM-dependent methyltransferase